jgi:alpha-galactosidase
MKLSLSAHGALVIETPSIVLSGIQPLLNSLLLEGSTCEVVRADAAQIELYYRAPALQEGHFGIRAFSPDQYGRVWLSYWVEELPEEMVLDSFGFRFERVENLRAYLCNGYTSWDGSFYVQPEAMNDFGESEPRPETGYAMTQLLPHGQPGSVVIGFNRHDRFQQTFTFDTRRQPTALTIQTLWDRKDRTSLANCESEKLVIFSHLEVENALREWARLVAEAAPIKPRLSEAPITGWCSWYNLYGSITEENLREHLRAAVEVVQREKLPLRVFQIDDGFTPEMGDWLEIKPQFPRGIKPLLDEILAGGFVPGLWIAPFVVGNRSHLYRDHPNWVVQDQKAGGPLVQMRFYGEFRWHKRSEEYYILDVTHPEAFAYLQRVFHTWRHEWCCEYFKTDFMNFGSEHGPDQAAWHTPGMTRIEIWRRLAEMIRQEIGDATWLGCGCPLWGAVGFVDGIRIGRDVGASWGEGPLAQSMLRDQATRNFANHILYQIDPDCVLLRNRYHHLNDPEIIALALYAGMSGGVIMTSDHLGELSPDRLHLLRMILPEARSTCDFPLLGKTEISYVQLPADLESHRVRHAPRPADPLLVQVRRPISGDSLGALLLLNTGSLKIHRSYSLESLGIHGPVYLLSWGEESASRKLHEQINVTLDRHGYVLYFYSKAPIEKIPGQLPSS